ncbi:MAG: amidohydrolase family protein [Propionibacteriaceae bacterium]|jgi:N-acetylglucosamine-6-phosphate deacetylase|nr:amidohydrolase family protein [Propionibacteriaceae bacterium]
MDYVIRGGAVVLPDRLLPGHEVWIRDEVILAVGADGVLPAPADARVVDATGLFVGPGFVDIHCHGGGGVWAHDDPVRASEHHLAHGTTSLLATTIPHPTQAEQVQAVAAIADAMAAGQTRNVVGIHMEGPYLNPAFGAYRELSRVARDAEYLEFVEAGRGFLRSMTVAPEIDGVEQLVYGLQGATGGGMYFSVGHSKAAPEQIRRLIPAGLRVATHVMNATGRAVSPTRYAGTREVGVDEAVLLESGITAELIADRLGRHVRPELLTLVCRVKGRDGVVLVTDATAADGAVPAGEADDGPLDVCFNAAGDLAGSALTMDGALGNIMRHTGLPLVDAWRMASHNPAAVLGLADSIGQVAPGRQANLVLARIGADAEVDVQQVWLRGRAVAES